MVLEHGDFSLIIKDVNGFRARINASDFVKLMKNRACTDRIREVFVNAGMPCEMDAINAIARKHKLAVIEDACQAWLADYNGRKCGTIGDLGCFSFQESKHLPSGEGGAIAGMSDELIDKCDSFHNCGRATGTNKGNGYFTRGNNYRMTQAQAVILMQQFDKLVKETEIRRTNADYLSANLGKIPGITPVRLPANSRPAWDLYAFRYDASRFNGLSRDKFARALSAEGVPCGSIYHEQYKTISVQAEGAKEDTMNLLAACLAIPLFATDGPVCPPEKLSVECTCSEVIQWDAERSTEWYEIQRTTVSTGSTTRQGMLWRWEMCDEDTGTCAWCGPPTERPVARDYSMPRAGTLYRYQVRACNGYGCGDWSNPVEYRGAPYQCYADGREVQCYVGDEVVSR